MTLNLTYPALGVNRISMHVWKLGDDVWAEVTITRDGLLEPKPHHMTKLRAYVDLLAPPGKMKAIPVSVIDSAVARHCDGTRADTLATLKRLDGSGENSGHDCALLEILEAAESADPTPTPPAEPPP